MHRVQESGEEGVGAGEGGGGNYYYYYYCYYYYYYYYLLLVLLFVLQSWDNRDGLLDLKAIN